MKKINCLKCIAKVAEIAAKAAAGSASLIGCYQPNEPKVLKNLKK